MTREGLNIAAECIGFVSALALTWQAYRLVRHQRAVRDLRRVAAGPRHRYRGTRDAKAERAGRGIRVIRLTK